MSEKILLPSSGRHTAEGHILPVRIYFEDTDFSGVVYHASYVRFFERGRTEYVRLLDVHHSALDAGEAGEPMAFAVHRMEIEFKRPARIDDVVEVVTRHKETRGARIILNQSIRRAGTILVDAVVTVVLVNKEGRACRIPELLAERFAAAPR
ncbi:tol-pal system-associated acyl-CoA thioesterase [Kaistia algarum]|uniref:tol-pal system-associated acyl-CoA thioesterase n=1 Tax=Kaistia algarum TaxID=2083279 RepID=UPI000CE7ED1E|nr:tol-pal system-associated acyl-CoA thioesterase [Kaistia algarum]MCX5516348.1 tol-pal system-associated acyl-CoA thioesterase [Kaistia algarum]PPE78735.1 tol-pal system-associated acyl-CoA thioesterase [Kaistia algarum]